MKLTRSDVEKKMARIANYKAQLADVQKSGLDPADNENIGFCYNAGQVILMERQSVLLSMIKTEQEELDSAEIVDELEIPTDVVGLGDTVTVLMQNQGCEPAEMSFIISDELIGQLGVVSTRSPIGMAIYGKNVGETVTCQTPGGLVTITILEKTRGLGR